MTRQKDDAQHQKLSCLKFWASRFQAFSNWRKSENSSDSQIYKGWKPKYQRNERIENRRRDSVADKSVIGADM